MRTTFKRTLKTKLVAIILILPFLFNCSKNEESIEKAMLPTVVYETINYESKFFTEGSTLEPVVDWNGNIGLFSIRPEGYGFNIDPASGVVSWDKTIDLGVNTIEVIAENTAGKVLIEITIDNIFQGRFKGGFNNDPNSNEITNKEFYTYDFDPSGVVNSNSSFGQETGEWNIIIDNSVFQPNIFIEFDQVIERYYVERIDTKVYLKGYWASKPYTDGDEFNGYIEFELVQ